MRKFLKSFFVIVALIATATCSHASNLPTDMWNYIKQDLPDAKQRFDSVIELSSGSLYIPLYPAQEIVNKNSELKILDKELLTDKYGIAVQKGNTELLEDINKVLQELMDNGKIAEYTIKFLGE